MSSNNQAVYNAQRTWVTSVCQQAQFKLALCADLSVARHVWNTCIPGWESGHFLFRPGKTFKSPRCHLPNIAVWESLRRPPANHRAILLLRWIFYFVFRSRSHSSASSFEDDFGVRKEVLLHGTYDDYIKEYKSRSGGGVGGSSKAPPSMAEVAAAYQKALTQVASALQQQGSSSKVGWH